LEHLYRHFDKNGVLLYVGISLSAINRLGQHKDNSHWFNEIKRVDIEIFKTREEVREAEKKAILKENPLHNIYRPTVKEQKSVYQESKDDLIKRIVSFNPAYSIDDIMQLLGMQKRDVIAAMDSGELSYIEILGKRSGPWDAKIHKKATGWQLIDFIERLERKRQKK